MNDSFFDSLSRIWSGMSGAATTGMRIVIIMILAWLLIAVLQRAISAFRIRVASRFGDHEAAKRAETLGRVFRYIAAAVVTALAGMLILGELGVSVAPILGAAGVVGLAVGFGAQSLVKDYFTGFFILLENQIRVGDVVKLGDHAGLVEVVTLRYVQLRDYEGNVHYLPNGEIKTVVNLSREFSYSVIDIGVAYRENTDEVVAIMRDVGQELRADPAYSARIVEELEIAGVDGWDDSAVRIRCRFKCVPLEQWGVRREYLRRLKMAFDTHGVEIPYPHLTVYAGQDKDGKAPPLPLQVARRPATAAA